MLRLKGDARKVRASEARKARAASGRAHGCVVAGMGQRATRVLVTRTDVGTGNARLSATATERAPHGARNPHSDARFVAGECLTIPSRPDTPRGVGFTLS